MVPPNDVPRTIPTTVFCKSEVRFDGHTCLDRMKSSNTASPTYAKSVPLIWFTLQELIGDRNSRSDFCCPSSVSSDIRMVLSNPRCLPRHGRERGLSTKACTGEKQSYPNDIRNKNPTTLVSAWIEQHLASFDIVKKIDLETLMDCISCFSFDNKVLICNRQIENRCDV